MYHIEHYSQEKKGELQLNQKKDSCVSEVEKGGDSSVSDKCLD